jgi:hypothetical protein
LPPRSLMAAITGAASDVLMVAASAFSPRTSRLSLDLRMPERRALLLAAIDAFLHGVDAGERHGAGAGQQRRAADQVCQQRLRLKTDARSCRLIVLGPSPEGDMRARH